jgi:uncharacterized protein YndB with AHSA1/START domain
MEIDTLTKAGLVARALDTVDRDGKPAKRITAARTYPTSVEDLWDAVTNIERIPRWFLPVTGDLRPGGRYQLEGNAGGEVLECDPPRRFHVTWEMGDDTSWVTVVLAGDPGGDETHLELEHVAHVPDEFWDQFGPGAVGVGWDGALVGLDLHLSSGEAVDPEEFRRWEATPDGAAFMATSSAAWAEAAVASGVEPEVARGWEERVTAFYTPSEE